MFFSGETVRGVMEITNHSKKTIQAIAVSLKQIEVLTAKERSILALSKKRHSTTSSNSTLIHEIETPPIPRGKKTRIDLAFDIPPYSYCTITSSTLVRVHHELIFNIDIPWAVDLVVAMPIVLIEKLGAPSGKGFVRLDLLPFHNTGLPY
ncbi:MAG: hypothetical protein GY859_27470 [Desulfobacterales bacterium]|nr:hypothetical protein [Desulfobacterales bacterium]